MTQSSGMGAALGSEDASARIGAVTVDPATLRAGMGEDGGVVPALVAPA